MRVARTAGGSQQDEFVAVALAPGQPPYGDIRLELLRGAIAVNVTWSLSASSECAGCTQPHHSQCTGRLQKFSATYDCLGQTAELFVLVQQSPARCDRRAGLCAVWLCLTSFSPSSGGCLASRTSWITTSHPPLLTMNPFSTKSHLRHHRTSTALRAPRAERFDARQERRPVPPLAPSPARQAASLAHCPVRSQGPSLAQPSLLRSLPPQRHWASWLARSSVA